MVCSVAYVCYRSCLVFICGINDGFEPVTNSVKLPLRIFYSVNSYHFTLFRYFAIPLFRHCTITFFVPFLFI